MRCRNCGKELPGTAAFCTSCGTQTTDGGPSTHDSVCPRCGAILEGNTKFCTQCGAPVIPAAPEPSCPRCGAVLPPDSKFCTSCGQRIPQTTQVDQSVSSQAVCPACGAAVSAGTRFCTSCGSRMDDPSRTAVMPAVPSVSPPRAVSSGSRKNIPLVIVCIVLGLAVIIACVFLVLPRVSGNSPSSTSSSIAGTSSTTSSSTKNDAQYSVLKTYYDKLAGYESQAVGVIDTFNSDYLNAGLSTRNSDYSSAKSVKSTIDSEYSAFNSALSSNGITSGNAYYQQGQNILRCYKLLSLRVDVVCQAWAIDVKYSNPTPYDSSITAPIHSAQENGTSKYKTEWESLYPSSAPTK